MLNLDDVMRVIVTHTSRRGAFSWLAKAAIATALIGTGVKPAHAGGGTCGGCGPCGGCGGIACGSQDQGCCPNCVGPDCGTTGGTCPAGTCYGWFWFCCSAGTIYICQDCCNDPGGSYNCTARGAIAAC